RSARDAFREAHDLENEALILSRSAENLRRLGENRSAWRDRLQSLTRLADVRLQGRRYGVLTEALIASLEEGLRRTGLHFGAASPEPEGGSPPFFTSDILLRRAEIHHALDADDRAAADLIDARQWVSRISDPSLARAQGAQADSVEGEVMLSQQPARA